MQPYNYVHKEADWRATCRWENIFFLVVKCGNKRGDNQILRIICLFICSSLSDGVNITELTPHNAIFVVRISFKLF